MIAVQADCQEITERTRSLQITDMPDVQQIETAVCSHQPFPSSTPFLTAIGKFLKIDDFWAHFFVVKTFGVITVLCSKYLQLAFD
jgi:hypothetical protein